MPPRPARRCKQVRGRAFCGQCAAKREQFFGWCLHLVCTTDGIPVAFDLLLVGVPVYGDKGDNAAADEATILADSGVRLVPIRKANMAPYRWADKLALRARTSPGLQLKFHAALLAVTITNAH